MVKTQAEKKKNSPQRGRKAKLRVGKNSFSERLEKEEDIFKYEKGKRGRTNLGGGGSQKHLTRDNGGGWLEGGGSIKIGGKKKQGSLPKRAHKSTATGEGASKKLCLV